MTSRRDFIKFGAAATASSLFVPRDLFAAYEKEAEAVGNDVVLRCCIMSDVHFDVLANADFIGDLFHEGYVFLAGFSKFSVHIAICVLYMV